MNKLNFNENWAYRHLDTAEKFKKVTLPHDAAMYEERSQKAEAGVNTGWFMGADYEYVKKFPVPEEYRDKDVIIEFEGVYRKAEVYINGKKASFRPYGYTNFYVTANEFLRCGEENEIRVIARNADQPNSRWYSGAGIYRPVNMYVGDKKRILLNGVKIRTLSIYPAVVEITVRTTGVGDIEVAIEKDGREIASDKKGQSDGDAVFAMEIPDAQLWSVETPELYTCRVKYLNDEQNVSFGVRTLSCDHTNGLTINGKRVMLLGACIHSDNGILGARSYKEAEERKVRLLKENGYNAIRSAHNPCSKYLLEACDKLGMLVMDEYADMWYIHKNRYDYAGTLEEWYARDIRDMVEKDYNHPSVVMYSLGNEVAETGEKRGIELFKSMKEVIKEIDAERPVTTGVNIFFNYLYSVGLGQYSDKKAEENPNKKVGSEFFNDLAGKMGDGFMKTMAQLPGCDRKTRDCYAVMDVAGYNYGIKRYKHDIKKYPERIILGSETFCSDAYKFYEFAKDNPALIGDFVWAGIDYVGEVGIGSWEYKEYAPSFLHGVGWLTAGSGRVDLVGTPLGEALYTKVAFEKEDKPQIAVVPVNHSGEKHSPSAWRFSNAIPSWSWSGCKGKKAKVEVYSRAPIVELYVNGKKVGRKKFKNNCRFDFTIKYEDGTITAVNLDKNGRKISENSLKTAGKETVLSVIPEKKNIRKGEICFVNIAYTDKNGEVKPLYHKDIEIAAENCELLAFGNASPYNEIGYTGTKSFTYYGRALAVVRLTGDKAKITVTDGKLTSAATVSAE